MSLLTSQDLVTWAAMSISVTVQGVLVGFAASKDTSPVSLAWIAAVGIVAASFFMALIARSNGYMVHYIALLRGTNREEFQRLPNLPPPSARQLAHGIHVVFIVAWFIVALIAFGVLHL